MNHHPPPLHLLYIQLHEYTAKMNFSYKIEHDFGLAPNPFWGYCTLAVCKSQIRKNKKLTIGSWIFGLGSRKLNNENHLIYAMEVQEKLTFEEYWSDPRFKLKRPVINGSLKMMYGDNFYYQESGVWMQEDSAHSLSNGINENHMKRDLSGEFVLISQNFFYFGENAIRIPEVFHSGVVCPARNYCSVKLNDNEAQNFVLWLQKNYTAGIIYGTQLIGRIISHSLK